MPTQLMPTWWSSSTASVNVAQQSLTVEDANNTAGSSTAPLADTVRNWLALRGLQASAQVEAPGTSEEPSVRLSRTQAETPTNLPTRERLDRVVGLKRWTGLIQEVADGLLTVELKPTDHQGPTFHAEFELSLLAPDEEEARPGDVVYLTTRFVQPSSGYKTVTTQLRLRRTGQWSEKEVAEITELASQQAAYFRHAD